MGLGFPAALIRHTILADVSKTDVRILAISGMTLFYLRKQISYFAAFPPFRSNLVVNTLVCLVVSLASTYLPRAEYALAGMTLGMFFYVFSNFRWTLTKDVTAFLVGPGS